MAQTLFEFVQLSVAASCLLIGWLAPQYAAKLWGEELSDFLGASPVTAAILAQCFWAVLLVVPVKGARAREPPAEGRQCRPTCRSLQSNTASLGFMFAILVVLIHMGWYASFVKTSVATNTVLWNTDTVTTPFVAMLINGDRLSRWQVFGGLLGLIGTCLTVGGSNNEDTVLGCTLVFAASLGYAVNAVLAGNYVNPDSLPVTRLLAVEGVWAIVFGVFGVLCISCIPAAFSLWWAALPSFACISFLGCTSLILNVSWLKCTELTSASWTAVFACTTIPITMVLDKVWLGQPPTNLAIVGAVLVMVGFTLVSLESETPRSGDERPAAVPEPAQTPAVCPRWRHWMMSTRLVPLLATEPDFQPQVSMSQCAQEKEGDIESQGDGASTTRAPTIESANSTTRSSHEVADVIASNAA